MTKFRSVVFRYRYAIGATAIAAGTVYALAAPFVGGV